jgi:hypothetical protein
MKYQYSLVIISCKTAKDYEKYNRFLGNSISLSNIYTDANIFPGDIKGFVENIKSTVKNIHAPRDMYLFTSNPMIEQYLASVTPEWGVPVIWRKVKYFGPRVEIKDATTYIEAKLYTNEFMEAQCAY